MCNFGFYNISYLLAVRNQAAIEEEPAILEDADDDAPVEAKDKVEFDDKMGAKVNIISSLYSCYI